jgi:hypothetical protein
MSCTILDWIFIWLNKNGMEESFCEKYYKISTWESRFAGTLAPKVFENVLVLNWFEFTTILENLYFL